MIEITSLLMSFTLMFWLNSIIFRGCWHFMTFILLSYSNNVSVLFFPNNLVIKFLILCLDFIRLYMYVKNSINPVRIVWNWIFLLGGLKRIFTDLSDSESSTYNIVEKSLENFEYEEFHVLHQSVGKPSRNYENIPAIYTRKS